MDIQSIHLDSWSGQPEIAPGSTAKWWESVAKTTTKWITKLCIISLKIKR